MVIVLLVPVMAALIAWRVWYSVPTALSAALSEPMKENVSGYLRNLCSLNRERDAASAAKLLALLTVFLFGREI